MSELWKPVADFEDRYEVSNLGRVISLDGYHKGRVLIGAKDPRYLRITLSRSPTRVSAHIHVIVATAFVPNPNALPQVNHIDGNKLNNVASNLEWVSARTNLLHARRILGVAIGENHHQSKLIKTDVYLIRALHEHGVSTNEIARRISKVGRSQVARIIKRNSWFCLPPCPSHQ